MPQQRNLYFGGSFFPPHTAHSAILKLALREAPSALIHIVPTKQNPLKKSSGATMELINAWIKDLQSSLSPEDFNRCRLNTSEIESTEKNNYTVDTLRKLAANNKEEWILLLGSDSAESFPKWKDPESILQMLKEIWIVPRGLASTKDQTQKKLSTIRDSLLKINAAIKIKFLEDVGTLSSSQLRDGALSHSRVEELSEFLGPHVLTVWKKLQS